MIPVLTAPQRKALAEVSSKTVTYVAVRHQEPEYKGARARRDVLDRLLAEGLIERGERTDESDRFTMPVTVTPLGRAVLAAAPDDQGDVEQDKKQDDEQKQEDES